MNTVPRRICAVALLGASSVVLTCDLHVNPPPSCLVPGAEVTAAGSYALVVSKTTAPAYSGAASDEVTLDNFSPFDAYGCPGGEAFLVHFDGCQLHATSRDVEHDTGRHASGAFLSASADIVADGQFTCTVHTTGSDVALNVDGGTLSLAPGVLSLDFGGTLVADPKTRAAFHFAGSRR